MAGGADSLKSILYALAANFSIAVAKFVAAGITGSGTMMAEGIHSLADCSNQGLLIFGLKQSKKPPSPDYPLGYGRATYFWSFIVALILFSMGGLFSIYEGLHKLSNPEPLRQPLVAVGVLVFGILVEGGSLFGCIREVNKVRGDRNYWQWFRESRQSELLVIFGEDLAAMLGMTLALVAVAVAMVTGNPIYDAFGSISIGILLVVVAIMIGVEVKSLLIGQGVDPRLRDEIKAFIESQPEVEKVFNLLTMQLGGDVMLAVKAQMVQHESQDALIEAINRCEVVIKKEYPAVLWSFFEPDVRD